MTLRSGATVYENLLKTNKEPYASKHDSMLMETVAKTQDIGQLSQTIVKDNDLDFIGSKDEHELQIVDQTLIHETDGFEYVEKIVHTQLIVEVDEDGASLAKTDMVASQQVKTETGDGGNIGTQYQEEKSTLTQSFGRVLKGIGSYAASTMMTVYRDTFTPGQ